MFRVIKLAKNFGQTSAIYAGIELATGDTIVTIDGDLQNDPKDINRLIQKLDEGYDFVIGWRQNRKDKLVSKKIPSFVANWLIRKFTESSIIDNGCALRAYRADLIKKFPLYSEMHRLLPTMLTLVGARVAQIHVSHHPRLHGESKYGLSRIYKVLFDLITLKTILVSHRYPFFGFGILASISGAISALFLGVTVRQIIMEQAHTTMIPFSICILMGTLGISLMMLGLLCHLIYKEGKTKAGPLVKMELL